MIDDVKLRARVETDRDAIRELCARALPTEDASDPDGLERVLWSPGMLSTVAVAGASVVGVVVGSLLGEPDGRSAATTVIAVDAAHRRRGLGSALLATFEADAARAGATSSWSGGGQPRFWWPGIDATDAPTAAFFAASGYMFDDEAPNMDVDLVRADLDERVVASIDIARLDPADWSSFSKWMAREWEDPWGEEASTALLRAPVSCHVATLDGEFVGFAAYDTNRRGWFGPMGSSPRVRGSGLGAELLRRCLRDYVAQGRDQCEIGWVGPAEFYAKTVGAVPGRRFIRLSKAL